MDAPETPNSGLECIGLGLREDIGVFSVAVSRVKFFDQPAYCLTYPCDVLFPRQLTVSLFTEHKTRYTSLYADRGHNPLVSLSPRAYQARAFKGHRNKTRNPSTDRRGNTTTPPNTSKALYMDGREHRHRSNRTYRSPADYPRFKDISRWVYPLNILQM